MSMFREIRIKSLETAAYYRQKAMEFIRAGKDWHTGPEMNEFDTCLYHAHHALVVADMYRVKSLGMKTLP